MEEKENIAVVKGFWHWMDGQLKSKDLLCKMCVYCLPSVSRDPFFFFFYQLLKTFPPYVQLQKWIFCCWIMLS